MELRKVIKRATLRRVKEMVQEYNSGSGFCSRYYVAVNEGTIKGCIGILFRSWYMSEVRHLCVKPEFRRRGIGSFLVREVLKKVRTSLIATTVRTDNPVSIQLFRNAGFRIVETIVNRRTGHEVVMMVKKMEVNR